MAMACWRASVEDLNLKDDILIPGTSYHVIGTLLDQIVENLAAVGLHLNMEPPPGLQTPNGLTISIIDQGSNHKWRGCMLTTKPEKSIACNIDHRLQSAS